MSSESCAACGRSRVMMRISMGGASLGKRLRYSVSQCPFRELEQHGGIAATGHHASCWRVWCKPEFLQVLAAFCASDAIPSVQQEGRSPIGIKHRGRGWVLLDVPTGCLTAVAVAGSADNRSATSLEDDVTAGASSG